MGNGDKRSGRFSLDAQSRRVFVDAREVTLTALEFDLLERLAEHPGWVLSYSQLSEGLCGYGASRANALSVHVAHLRRKLAEAGAPDLIETVRGIGYRLARTAQPGNRDAPFRLFVGRHAEMGALSGALWDVRSGHGRLVAVSGDAGIGKSRLVEEFLADATSKEADIARCSVGSDDPLPYWPWSRVLCELMRRKGLQDDARLAPILQPNSRDGDGRSQDAATRDSLFATVLDVLRDIARGGLTVIILEDLHRADASSLMLLRFLAREMSGLPLLIVISFRDTGAGTSGHLSILRGVSAESSTIRLPLRPLSKPETAEMLAAAEPSLADLAPVLHAQTGGNPLFLTEVLHALLDDGLDKHPTGLTATLGRYPSIRELVAARTADLSEEGAAVIEVAAIIGHEFDLGVISSVLSISTERLFECVQECLAQRILLETESPWRFRFLHALVRDAVYESLLPLHRMRLHAAVGEILESSMNGVGREASTLAAHFYEAAGLGFADSAMMWSERAGEHAMGHFAYEEAAEHFGRAIALADTAAVPMERRAEVRRGLEERLGDALLAANRPAEAGDAFRRALGSVPEGADIESSRLHRKVAACAAESRLWEEAALALRRADRAIGEADEGRPDAWWSAWLEVRLQEMWLGYHTGQAMPPDRRRLSASIERHATPAQRIAFARCHFLSRLRADAHVPSETAMRFARMQWEAARDLDSPPDRAMAEGMFGVSLMWSGALEEARRHLLEGLRLSEETGLVATELTILGNLATLSRLEGDVPETRRLSERLLIRTAEAETPDNEGGALGNLAWVSWRSGDVTATTSHARRALALLDRAPAFPFRWLATWPLIAALLATDPGDASRYLDDLTSETQQAMRPEVARPLGRATEARDAGDAGGCEEALREAENAGRPFGYT